MEGRGPAKGNMDEHAAHRTQSRVRAPDALDRVREAARGDAIDHEWLMKFVGHRIADVRILRLVKKWLTAGILDKGAWSTTETGTPQGATISPLLANVFLHYVFDLTRRFVAAASAIAPPGTAPRGLSNGGSRTPVCFVRIPGTASTPTPEVGAECVSSACSDLCGGAARVARRGSSLPRSFQRIRTTPSEYTGELLAQRTIYNIYSVV
jgi:hypothetical protein